MAKSMSRFHMWGVETSGCEKLRQEINRPEIVRESSCKSMYSPGGCGY